MAVYKVPQDVEAEDKLIAWLSFRQFVYLVIAVGGCAAAFFLYQASPFLIIIPLPFIIIFGVLALPLKKDQPLETYLLAILRFYLKPKTRRWDADGTVSYVEITAPKLTEQNLSKGYGAETAQQRLDYLAHIMDSRGWAYKGVAAASPTNESIAPAVAAEAQGAVDVMDESADLSRSFQQLIQEKDAARREEVTQSMQQAVAATPPAGAATGTPADDTGMTAPTFDPYPNSMHQRVLQPLDPRHRTVVQKQPTPAVPPKVSPDIIRLASNDDLSISALAHEAHRLQPNNDEVVIQLH